MSQFIDALAQSRAENRRQYILLLVLAGVAAIAIYGWHTATREIDVHIPPDLRNGATVRAGERSEVAEPNVYAFGHYIWQQVNRWQTDGSKDYGARIYELQHYLTPSCRSQLVEDMNLRHKRGELTKRTRSIAEIPGLGYVAERVTIRGANAWQVLLDAQVLETQNGVTIKDSYLRYPLRIVRYDIDREKNPFRLALDCFGAERPQRLDPKAVEVAQRDHGVDVATKPEDIGPGPLDAAKGPARGGDATPAPATAASTPATERGAPRTAIEPVSLPQPTARD